MSSFLFSAINILIIMSCLYIGSGGTSSTESKLLTRSDVVTEIRLLRKLVNQETLIRMGLENKIIKLKHNLQVEINKRMKSESENKGRYGEMYTRWGKDCCRNGSQLVYSGRVGGSNNYKHSGAAVDYLCLPSNPIYEKYDPKVNNQAFVFGAEYDIWNINIPGTLFDKSRYTEKGVPCAVCRPTTPSNVIMIPGRNACYKGMREEYRGYLMAGYYSHVGASEYICVDRDAGTITPKVHSWKKILYAVESMCGGPMECPPYINGAEMTCVVCTL